MTMQKRMLLGIISIFVILVFVAQVVSVLSRKAPVKIVPKAPEIRPLIEKSHSISTFTYNGEAFTIPKELPTYLNASSNISPRDWTEGLAETLHLSKLEGRTAIWIDKDTEEQVIFQSLSSTAQYLAPKSIRDNPNVPIGIEDINILIEAAQAFLDQFHFSPTPNPIRSEIEFFTNPLEPIPASQQEAVLVRIPFQAKINEYDFQLENSAKQTASVYVSTNGEVIKAEMTPILSTLKESGLFPALSLEEALLALQKGEGAILSLSAQDTAYTLKDLSLADFSEVVIEYRQSLNNALVYPYFRFSGTASGNGKTVGIIMTLPALKTVDAQSP